MAKQIESTPDLENEDAKAFWDTVKNTKFDSRKDLEFRISRAVFSFFSKNK